MRVLITSESPEDRDGCRQTVLRIGLECGSEDSVAPAQLRMRLTRSPAADLVLVVLSDGGPADWAAVRAAAGGDRPVYAVGPDDGRLADEATAAGASGYFARDRLREALLAETSQLPAARGGDIRRGRAIAVTGVQPGCGVTTTAAGLAFALAADGGAVGLAELTNATPDLALALDLTPPHSLADLIRESERMDAGMVRAAAARHKGGVDVLAYPPETLRPEAAGPRQVEDFLVLLRTVFDWAVFDLGHGPTEGVRQAAAHAEVVVVVTRIDVPGIRLTRAFVKDLTANGVSPDRLVLVGNRYGQSGQMNWRTAEEAVRTPVAVWLPDDPGGVNKAVTEGQPIAGGWSKLARELKNLAKTVRAKATK
jgi:pilus assembly protein CpaE